MRERKILGVFIIFLLILLLAGCKKDGNTGVGPKETPFIGGKVGFLMSFIDGAPPEEIFDNNQYPFSVAVKLENKGEDDVAQNEGYVKIVGINPPDFNTTAQLLNKSLPSNLKGSKKNFEGTILDGDTTVVEFNNLNYQPDIAGNFNGPVIRAELCYNYKTRTSTQICVKEDLLTGLDNKEICKLSEDKKPQNSGGPIQITSSREDPLGTGKVQFSFVVGHVGENNDRFYKKGTNCEDKATNRDKNVVFVNMTSDFNGVNPKCEGLQEPSADSSSGYITLFDKAPRTVVCSLDVSGATGEFEDLLTVDLEYRYHQFIEKSILVKDVSTT